MQAGDVLDDRYELIETIGEGAFGVVWKARDARIQRHVAVKVMQQGGNTAKDVARFVREVATAGALNHAHIVTVHDFGEHRSAGRPVFYLVMELLDGVQLNASLADEVPPLARALTWAAQIADALAVAHRAGVVHRDIKPANVMVLSSGSVKVVDFGIARTETADDGVTSTHAIIGTPAYMAPERFEGKGLDARSDLYAFGCLLYELCTGQPPFRGGVFQLMHLHGTVVPEPPSTVRTGIPPEVDRLVLDLLAKDPAQRPPGADQVAGRLRAATWSLENPPPAYTPTVRDTSVSDDAYARSRREEADALFEETRARAAQAATEFELNLAKRREQTEREIAALRLRAEEDVRTVLREAEAAKAQANRDAQSKRDEADALFEETRSMAANAAAEFESMLGLRREQSERDLAARQAKAENRLAEIESRSEQLRLEAEKLATDAERRARRTVETAQRQAEDIVADANAKADLIRSESERELAALTLRRDSLTAQLTNVREMLATLTGSAVAAASEVPPQQQR
ncbi:protein kinase [Kitasatospora sp. NPDC047058]|uniref:serine/threonine-protein kinase n=1 Tax=Kitasatospora sp. NPDC047058 TaxID=3155620 RepID=UPI0033C42593